MTVFALGGQQVVVDPKNQYFFFFRRQGISIQISPKTHWWCAWLCSSTTNVDAIECSANLTGITGGFQASGECSDCGSLDVMGPSFWGFGVPAAYGEVSYKGTVRIDGRGYEFGGSSVF